MIKFENTEVVGWSHAIRGMRNPLESWEKSDSGWNAKYDAKTEKERSKYIEAQTEYDYEYYIGPNDQDLMARLRDAGTDHRKFMRFIDVYVDIVAPLYWWKEFKTYRAGRVFGDDEPDICPIPEDYLEFDIEMNSCSTMHKIHSKEFTLEDFSHEHLMEDEAFAFPLGGGWRGLDALEILKCTVEGLNNARTRYLSTKNMDISELVKRVGITEWDSIPGDTYAAKRSNLAKKYWYQMIQLLPSSYNQRRTLKLTYEVLANMYKSRQNHKLDEWHSFCDWIKTLPCSDLITGEFIFSWYQKRD